MSILKNPLEAALWKAGYVRSPNKIYSDIPWTTDGNSPLWYAGGPGIPEPGNHGRVNDVQVIGERLRVFKLATHSRELITETVAEFDNVESFLDWCKVQGQISEPGMPAFSNSWD